MKIISLPSGGRCAVNFYEAVKTFFTFYLSFGHIEHIEICDANSYRPLFIADNQELKEFYVLSKVCKKVIYQIRFDFPEYTPVIVRVHYWSGRRSTLIVLL